MLLWIHTYNAWHARKNYQVFFCYYFFYFFFAVTLLTAYLDKVFSSSVGRCSAEVQSGTAVLRCSLCVRGGGFSRSAASLGKPSLGGRDVP